MKYDFNQSAYDYDKWYETELGAKIDVYEKKLFLKFLKKLDHPEILEIGAGTGHWTQLMSQHGFKVTGIDVADKMLAIARSKHISNATFKQIDVHHLPYSDESIENVVMVATLEFVDDQQQVLNEIYRVLKRGGKLLVGALNKDSSISVYKAHKTLLKDACFHSFESFKLLLTQFGEPMVEGTALFPDVENLKDVDSIEEEASQELLNQKGNFLVGFVEKA